VKLSIIKRVFYLFLNRSLLLLLLLIFRVQWADWVLTDDKQASKATGDIQQHQQAASKQYEISLFFIYSSSLRFPSVSLDFPPLHTTNERLQQQHSRNPEN